MSREEVKRRANWSALPYDLLVSISNRLADVGDFVAFSCVCPNWHLVHKNRDWKPYQRIPWLMLGDYNDNEHHITKRLFLSLTRSKMYNIPLPEASGSKCWGTSHGLIVSFNQDLTIRVLNPISRASINLPPYPALSNSNDYWFGAIQKVVILNIREKFVAMIIHKHNKALAFSKFGDRDWTPVNLPANVNLVHVMCFKDQIFAITMVGTLMLVEIDGPTEPRALFVASPPPKDGRGLLKMYLVDSRDELLLVFVYGENFVNAYKLDILKKVWKPLSDVGDAILWFDDYGCISVCEYGYLKPNMIFIVHDNSMMLDYGGAQMVNLFVIKMKGRQSKSFGICDGSLGLYSCPLWMVPMLW